MKQTVIELSSMLTGLQGLLLVKDTFKLVAESWYGANVMAVLALAKVSYL